MTFVLYKYILRVSGTHSSNVYKSTNNKIERSIEIFAHAMYTTVVIIMLPSLLYTVVNFYLLDAGRESFFLFYPTWFVFTIKK